MRTHPQEEVKAVVYSAHMPVPQEQSSQDMFLALLLGLAALAGLSLGQFF